MDIFDMKVPMFHRKAVPGGKTDGHLRVDEDDDCSLISMSLKGSRIREPSNTDYAAEYRQRDVEEAASFYATGSAQKEEASGGLDDVDTTTLGAEIRDDDDDKSAATLDVYKRYDSKRKIEVNLAVTLYKDRILEMIGSCQVLIIAGATGCGKTTQIPQYVLDSCWDKEQHCNIVVTQPRRIAAIKVAERVCDERSWDLGTICGYKIGNDGKVSDDTRLHYVTTGVLLNQIIMMRDLSKYSHIFLDEVHERDTDMDFLLLLVRKLLRFGNPNVKVILMSATMDTNKFSRYFRKYSGRAEEQENALVFKIPRNQKFRVDEYYLENLEGHIGNWAGCELDMPKLDGEGYDLCTSLIEVIHGFPVKDKTTETILVFLPGIGEIEEMEMRLRKVEGNSSVKWDIVVMHSSLPTENYKRIEAKPPIGAMRIILSTNMAESSITIPDVKYVIDFGLTKVLRTDPETGYSGLVLRWASKNNLRQRAGRVGRVMSGRVYRLMRKNVFEMLDEDPIPEMLLQSLENVVLKTKLIDMGSPKELLALAIDPPELSSIESTVLTLKEVGGLLTTRNGVYDTCDGDLTHLGSVMAQLPLDVRHSKLIALGYAFGVFNETIVIAAALNNTKSVFSNPFKSRMQAYKSVTSWADKTKSDHIALFKAYKIYCQKLQDGNFQRPDQQGIRQWARQSYVDHKVLREVHEQVIDLRRRLEDLYTKENFEEHSSQWTEAQQFVIIKLAVGGAYYPNYFGRSISEDSEDRAMRQLCGHDPHTCAYLTGFPPKQTGPLYAEKMKRLLQPCDSDINIIFEPNTQKTILNFRPEFGAVSSEIAMGVYYAVLMKKLRMSLKFKVLPAFESQARAEKAGITAVDERESPEKSCDPTINLPPVTVTVIQFFIFKVLAPDHFIAQRVNGNLNYLERILNDPHPSEPVHGQPDIGQVYMGLHPTKQYYVRVRVEKIKGDKVWVNAIDYGNIYDMKLSDLMKPHHPMVTSEEAYAYDVRLALVQPRQTLTGARTWPKAAIDAAGRYLNTKVYGQIFSVVNGVLRVILLGPRGACFNKILIDNKLAEEAEETSSSLENHRIRQMNNIQPSELNKLNQSQWPHYWKLKECVPSPPDTECPISVELKGPSSPLEVNLCPLVRIGASFSNVSVVADSANAVILQEMFYRRDDFLLVASHVAKNEAGTSLNIGRTSILPSYPGVPALVCLLFTPRAQLRVNGIGTRYASALCGLGTDSRGIPINPEHDFDITFNVHFTEQDIKDINALRSIINNLLENPQQSIPDLLRERKKIRNLLTTLVTKRREDQMEEPPRSSRWDTLLFNIEDSKKILPQHQLLELEDEAQLADNAQLLIDMLKRDVPFKPNFCNLCNDRIGTITDLGKHIASKDHRAKSDYLLKKKDDTAESLMKKLLKKPE